MALKHESPSLSPWREKIHEVIFGVDTRAGRLFDVALLWCILLSVLAVMLESVGEIRSEYAVQLNVIEWTFTILFSVEYILRLLCVRRPGRYAVSFFGMVDLMAVLPTYLELFIPGAQPLLVIRALRLLRIFRILKLMQFLSEADIVMGALRQSRRKIFVFLGTVFIIVLIVGTVMYMIEGHREGTRFESIPHSVYWAIVTVTTVGYGDIAPQTPIGQILASALMMTGYCIIAVPTGIVTVELAQAQASARESQARSCPSCGATGHDSDAEHCKHCGDPLNNNH